MSMFFPFGVFNKEIIDPEVLGDEFQEAIRTAFSTTQYQWNGGSMEGTTDDPVGGIDKLDVSKICNIHAKRVNASFQKSRNSEQWLAATDGSTRASDPDTRFHVIPKSENTWLIPYNKGFHAVGDGDVSVEWTSEYPELVLSCFSFQYARWRTEFTSHYQYWSNLTAATAGQGLSPFTLEGKNAVRPRLQVRLEVDGARMPGTGPIAPSSLEQYRGQGLVDSMLRTAIFSCNVLPAGDHSVVPLAAQASAMLNDDTEGVYFEYPPVDGVAICQRSNTVIRIAMGGHLGT